MHINQILDYIQKELNEKKIKNPHFEAELLLSFILKKSREWLLAHADHKLTDLQITNYKLQIKRRCDGMPLAYLTNRKEFYGQEFIVNKNVLIPRPETELMVDQAMGDVRTSKKIAIIDVGTGSGCVIIALLKELSSKASELILHSKFIATDISKPALTVAKENAKIHKVDKKIKFLQGNLLKPVFSEQGLVNRGNNIIILANLPYLTPVQFMHSPTIQNEPKQALIGGFDGLKYYRELFRQIKYLQEITNHQSTITIFCEIDPGQVKKIRQLAMKRLPEFEIDFKRDSARKIRFCCLFFKHID